MRFTLAAVLATGTFAGALIVPSPAGATEGRIAVESAVDTTVAKSATAVCDPGTKVLGMGGRIKDGLGGVVLTSAIVNSTLTSVTATGLARPGHMTPWSVVAFAVCADPGYIEPTRAVASGKFTTTATVTCPAGKIVYSSGFTLAARSNGSFVDKVKPENNDRVIVHATGPIAPADVTAAAICGYPMSQHDHLSLSARSGFNTRLKVNLPAPSVPGYGFYFGSGGEVLNGQGRVMIDGFGPNSTLDKAIVTAVEVTGVAPADPRARAAGVNAGVNGGDEWALDAHADFIGIWYA
jgi:hypothetical protein